MLKCNKMSQKRILVTGSNGFVGRNLVKELKRYTMDVVDLTYPNGNRIDIGDWKRIKEMEDIHMVYHLAAITQVPFSFENPREMYTVNVLGTLNILELCRLHDIEKIVFASSYVYGPPRYLPIDEKHPVQPTNPYARSKVMGEDLCKAYYEDYGLKCVILRAFNIYGEGQSENFLIPSILKQLVKGEIELNDPEPKRDYIYIKDVINAYIKAGEYDESGFEIFNIGSGRSYSVDEIVRKLIDSSGRNVVITYQNKRRKGEIMNSISDSKKAKEKLCWEASVSIDEGLKIVLKSYKKHLKF